MRISNLLALSLLLFAASPAAAAVMKTSAPPKPGAQKMQSSVSAPGEDRFRPTGFLGIQRAETLAEGDMLMDLSNPKVSWGARDGIELGLGAGLTFNSAANNYLSLPIMGYGKVMLAKSDALSMALGGSANLTFTSVGNNNPTLNGGLFLPISLWKVGSGDLHVMPAVNFAVAPSSSFGSNNMSVAVGYELPVNEKWSLLAVDTVTGAGNNTLSLGNRVALTPNLTADLGSLSFTRTDGSSNTTINLLTVGASFGASVSDFYRAWGY